MAIPNRLLAAVLLAGPLAGCGGKQEPPAPPPPVTQAASPAAIVVSPVPEPSAARSPAARVPPSPGPVATAKPAPATTLAPAGPAATPAAVPAVPPAATAPPAASSASPRPAEAPAAKLPTRPRPQGKVTLPARLGAVTFDHPKHADVMAIPCIRCHHANRPEKPLAAQQQACRDCHTSPPTPPMKVGLQAAFHDPKASAGTCIDCHKEAVAKGKHPPVGCPQCHKRQ